MTSKNKKEIHWFKDGTFAIKVSDNTFEDKPKTNFSMWKYKTDPIPLGRFSILQNEKEIEFKKELLKEFKQKLKQINKRKGKNDVNKK